MITFITGLPGHGKTLLAVSKVQQWYPDRPVFYQGIADLKLPWTETEGDKWHEKLPNGAVLVVDEAQHVFKQRGPKEPVPPHIQKLTTHRHKGIDIVLITQDARLIDAFARRLGDRHLHVQRNFGLQRSVVFEWNSGIQDNVRDYHTRQQATRSHFKFPKKSFSLYHSAEVHTVKRRIPWQVWGVFALVAFLALVVLVLYFRFQDRLSGDKPDVDIPPSSIRGDATPRRGGSPLAGGEGIPETTAEYLTRLQPRIPDLPHSAPVYDSVATVRDFPRVKGCIQWMTGDAVGRCRCYSQQGTVLRVSRRFCEAYVTDRAFDHFQEPQKIPAGGIERSDSPASERSEP